VTPYRSSFTRNMAYLATHIASSVFLENGPQKR
jgi:hypothetical protein